MDTKFLIPAVFWFFSIFNFAGYNKQIDEEQGKGIFTPTPSKLSGNTNYFVSPPNTYIQKPSGHRFHANKNVVFRHLFLTPNGCDGFISNNKKHTGDNSLE